MQWTLIFWPIHYYGTFYFDDVGDTTFDKNNQTDRANVGSARSTRVRYENGVYSSILSGTNGYYSYYDASASTDKYKYSGTYNDVVIGSIVREAGTHPRNVKNRVRCVRKQ